VGGPERDVVRSEVISYVGVVVWRQQNSRGIRTTSGAAEEGIKNQQSLRLHLQFQPIKSGV